MRLEDEYPGDEAFARFSKAFEQHWLAFAGKQALLEKLSGDVELARAVAGQCAESSLEWLDQEVPALGSMTPLECLATKSGMRRLRTCLMRMP